MSYKARLDAREMSAQIARSLAAWLAFLRTRKGTRGLRAGATRCVSTENGSRKAREKVCNDVISR